MQRPRLSVLLDETAQVKGYQTEGAFPMFGNSDRGIDQISTAAVGASRKIARRPDHRNDSRTRSTLTITGA